jgi:D-3-phosphoglycerate dehydrogenase / 2-oxoglutarate reductase
VTFGHQGQGIDNVDLDAAKEYGIAVCNTPALNSEAVAELTMALILDIARRVSELDRRARAGEKIVRSKFLGKSMYGRTIGIVGMGNIGKVVASKWKGAMVSPKRF